jgi:hypothetical protein
MVRLTATVIRRPRNAARYVAIGKSLHNPLVERERAGQINDTIAITIRMVGGEDRLEVFEQ